MNALIKKFIIEHEIEQVFVEIDAEVLLKENIILLEASQ